MNKTRLATYSGISYDKFSIYLEWLLGRGFVSFEDGTVHLLEEGRETYERLVEWILKYVGRLQFTKRR